MFCIDLFGRLIYKFPRGLEYSGEQGQKGAAHPKKRGPLSENNMSENNTIKGTVETVLAVKEFASGFRKRVLVINTGGDYPQTIPVEFVKDKIELLSGLYKGQEVEASVNIRGNEYNGKYYANIQGWKLDKGDAPVKQQAMPEPKPVPADDDEMDDIPF